MGPQAGCHPNLIGNLHGAGLLVIEHVLPERREAGSSALPAARLDLHMLVLTSGGRERTESEFRHLLAKAGFELHRVIPTQLPLSLVEGRPR